LADAADHAGQKGIGQHLALLGDEAAAHADLAVLAVHAALDLDLQRRAVRPNAGQRLGAQVGALRTDVAVAGGDDEALRYSARKRLGSTELSDRRIRMG
jgi:hypothetical protein